MKIFEHPNIEFGWMCPVCHSNEDKPIVLLSKAGTRNGDIVEVEQCHFDCLDLWIYEDVNCIAMKVGAIR